MILSQGKPGEGLLGFLPGKYVVLSKEGLHITPKEDFTEEDGVLYSNTNFKSRPVTTANGSILGSYYDGEDWHDNCVPIGFNRKGGWGRKNKSKR